MMVQKKSPAHFKFHYADVGEILAFGTPKTHHSKNVQYQTAALAMEPKAFDVYMVDGRYRVACAMAALMHAEAKGAQPGKFFVLVHDYDQRSRKYDIIEKVAKVVEIKSKIAVFTKDPAISNNKIYAMWKEYNTKSQ